MYTGEWYDTIAQLKLSSFINISRVATTSDRMLFNPFAFQVAPALMMEMLSVSPPRSIEYKLATT